MTTADHQQIAPRPTTGPQSSEDWGWLEEWQIQDQLPATFTEHKLTAAYQRIQQSLAPADEKAMAVALDQLFRFARTFGIPSQDATNATAFYRDALKEYPPDLLTKAVRSVCANWKWGNRMPLPADLKEAVSKEWLRRQLLAMRLRQAMRKVG